VAVNDASAGLISLEDPGQRDGLDLGGRHVGGLGRLGESHRNGVGKPIMALYVLVRRNRTWWLAAGQNTIVRPQPA